jgi:hypothetical protein
MSAQKVNGWVKAVYRTRAGFVATCTWKAGCDTQGDFPIDDDCPLFGGDRFTAEQVPRPLVGGHNWGGVTLVNIRPFEP